MRQRHLAGHRGSSLRKAHSSVPLSTPFRFSHPTSLSCFETGTCDVAQAVLKALILLPLPQSVESWDGMDAIILVAFLLLCGPSLKHGKNSQ